MGAQTADLVLGIFNNPAPPLLGPIKSTTQAFRVDARELERWGLSAQKLPADTLVAHTTPSLWESHPRIVTATLGMSDRQLKDIGLTRSEIAAAAKGTLLLRR